jgi:hypothetical protein
VRVIDVHSGEQYQWGSGSVGWHLLNRADLGVIQQRVPCSGLARASRCRRERSIKSAMNHPSP